MKRILVISLIVSIVISLSIFFPVIASASTVATSVTTTTSLSITGRAICRGTDRVHVVFMNNSQVMYTNSSDGETWGTPLRLDAANYVPAAAPVIDCSGSKIFVAWKDSDTRPDINYANSTNEGGTWSSPTIWRDGTGTGAQGVVMGNVMFGYGSNIWVSYQWDAGTPESMIVDNSSLYTGASPTITRKDMVIDCNAGVTSFPGLFVNVSGTTEHVYMPHSCNSPAGAHLGFNYTHNSGSTWSSSYIWYAVLGHSISLNIMNNVLYHIMQNQYSYGNLSSTGGSSWSAWDTTRSNHDWDESLASDITTNIYWFYTSNCGSTPSNNCDVGLIIYNSSGTYVNDTYIDLNSNNSTLTNAKWNASNGKIEYVFFNKSAIYYDYISLGGGVSTSERYLNIKGNITPRFNQSINLTRFSSPKIQLGANLSKMFMIQKILDNDISLSLTTSKGLALMRYITLPIDMSAQFYESINLGKYLTEKIQLGQNFTRNALVSQIYNTVVDVAVTFTGAFQAMTQTFERVLTTAIEPTINLFRNFNLIKTITTNIEGTAQFSTGFTLQKFLNIVVDMSETFTGVFQAGIQIFERVMTITIETAINMFRNFNLIKTITTNIEGSVQFSRNPNLQKFLNLAVDMSETFAGVLQAGLKTFERILNMSVEMVEQFSRTFIFQRFLDSNITLSSLFDGIYEGMAQTFERVMNLAIELQSQFVEGTRTFVRVMTTSIKTAIQFIRHTTLKVYERIMNTAVEVTGNFWRMLGGGITYTEGCYILDEDITLCVTDLNTRYLIINTGFYGVVINV